MTQYQETQVTPRVSGFASAGALGAGLAGRLFELGWVCHAPSASRAVRLTGEGRAGLAATFGVRLDDAEAAAGQAAAGVP